MDGNLKLESMFLDYIPYGGWEIAFSVIPTREKPVRYAVWERDPRYKIRNTGMVKLKEGSEIPQTIRVNYFDGQLIEESPVTGLVERVPQYITILGARKRPLLELPAAMLGIRYGGCESKGSKWMSLAEMLAKNFPLETMKNLHGDWRKRTEEEYFPLHLKLLEKKLVKDTR